MPSTSLSRLLSMSRSSLLVLIALMALAAPGCITPEQAVSEVDREAYGIVGEKQEMVRGERYVFVVDPPQARLQELLKDPETGQVGEDAVVEVSLADALELAARNSREFQDAKENLYRSALALMRELEDYRNRPFGLFDSTVSKASDFESLSGRGEFGVTNLIERGGSYALSLGMNFLRVVSSPTDTNLSSFLNLSISLPFLRNAGQQIVWENVRQADRNALYAMRDFERFKQTYGVRVISAYLRLLVARQRLENEKANVKTLEFARLRNEAREAEGRISRIQVDQARQSELSGKNRLVVTEQSYEAQLDAFKNLIGIPVDVKLEIRMEDLQELERLIAEEVELDVRSLTRVALRSRLDLRNAVDSVADALRRIRIAENQLLPDLTLNLSASPISYDLKPLKYNFDNGTYSAGLSFDAGLDRDLESISLRQALLDLQRALRAEEAFVDQVKLDVQNAVRQLLQARETYRLSVLSVKLAEERVESSSAFLELGRADTRDFLESQDALLQNQNQLVANLVDYRIAWLNLLSDTGTLVVSSEGLDHETSAELLSGK